jgi:hypothetical protein
MINIVSKDEHVPEMERFIRVIKERTCATHAMLPFTQIPKKMLVAMVTTNVFYINAFPWPQGVSQELSPYTIIEGVILDYDLHFQVIFGEYAQTYEGTDNTNKERTVGAIALGPSGNLQGGIKKFSLDSGEILNRAKQDYNLLPMPADVIKRVNRMARKSRSGLTFGDRHNADDPDDESDDDDSDYTPDRVSTNIDVEINDAEDDIDMVNDGNSDDDHDDIETPGVIPPETNEDDQNHDDDHQQDQDATAYDSEPDGQELDDTSTEESDPDSEDEQDNEPTTRSGRAIRTTQCEDYVYTSIGSDPKSLQCAQFLQKTQDVDIDLSQQKTKKLNSHEQENFLRTTQFMEASNLRSNVLLEYAMAQMSVSKGIKTHGDAGKAIEILSPNKTQYNACTARTSPSTLKHQRSISKITFTSSTCPFRLNTIRMSSQPE